MTTTDYPPGVRTVTEYVVYRAMQRHAATCDCGGQDDQSISNVSGVRVTDLSERILPALHDSGRVSRTGDEWTVA